MSDGDEGLRRHEALEAQEMSPEEVAAFRRWQKTHPPMTRMSEPEIVSIKGPAGSRLTESQWLSVSIAFAALALALAVVALVVAYN